ncbi:MAG TPA: CFI-box-CTERM domain-containing protein [Terriglobales bacterium]|nr:CFI-box-CTERM domain-containing protein [Terriglobales bacterium]
MIPRMAVAGYFFFDGKTRLGVVTDWNWAMSQWDRVAAAKQAVRLVVVDWSFAYGMPATAGPNSPNAADMKTKLTACHSAGQLVFGYAAGSGGAIPLQPPTGGPPWWLAPRAAVWPSPLTGPVAPAAAGASGALMSLSGQIDTWQTTYPGLIDGIYVDEGPTDCLSNPFAASVPTNYAAYCSYIREKGFKVFLLAAGYPDNDPASPGWFQALPWDYVGVWEAPLTPAYENQFGATDYCNSPNYPTNPSPSWWNTANICDLEKRITRVHIINNGVDAEASANHETFAQVLTRVKDLAVSRGAGTMWITETAQDPVLGSVYGMLPDYWDDEVALFATVTPPSQTWIQNWDTIPPGRFGACMTYDAASGQIILFGGESYQAGFGDTWAYDGSNWTQLAPATSPPGVLHGHMAFDPTRGVVVLWGGVAAGGSYPTETWTWNGSTWTRQTPSVSPAGRSNGMMAWDGKRIILYGGETNNVRRADMWAWDGQNWTKLSDSAAPGIRVSAVMTYFPCIQRVVLQGGSSDTQTLSDTWQWDGTSWTQQHPAADPGYRVGAASAFDGTRVLVFGGGQSAVVPLLDDLWAWDGNNWSAVPNQGTWLQFPGTPSPRRLAALAEYPLNPGVVLFGGDDDVHSQALGDTWMYGAPPPPTRCFVATALFGPLSPEVATLRAFRDEWLSQHALSRAVVKIYYRQGPKLAALILRFPILKSAMRMSIRACIRFLGSPPRG